MFFLMDIASSNPPSWWERAWNIIETGTENEEEEWDREEGEEEEGDGDGEAEEEEKKEDNISFFSASFAFWYFIKYSVTFILPS